MRSLKEAAKVKVDVIHRLVDAPLIKDQLKTFPNSLVSPHLLNVPWFNAFPQVGPVLSLASSADLPVLVVAWQTVVSTSLDVHCHKIQSSPASFHQFCLDFGFNQDLPGDDSKRWFLTSGTKLESQS